MTKQLVLEKDRFFFFKWPKSSKHVFFRNSKLPIYSNFFFPFYIYTELEFFYKHVMFFSKSSLGFSLLSQNLAVQKNLKRTLSKKVSLNFLSPVFMNMFKKPAQVRMGNGKGQKLNKQIYRFNYGQPIFYSRRLKVKSSLKIGRKVRSKMGISTRVMNFRKFFFAI